MKLLLKSALVHFFREGKQNDYLEALDNAINEITSIFMRKQIETLKEGKSYKLKTEDGFVTKNSIDSYYTQETDLVAVKFSKIELLAMCETKHIVLNDESLEIIEC